MKKEILFKILMVIKNEMDWKNNIRGCQSIVENVYGILNPDHWKVIRIQKPAFDFMLLNACVKKDGMKVQRAHIYPRRETFENVMQMDFNNGQEIYDYIKSRDICCLSLHNKNSVDEQPDDIKVPEELLLFLPNQIGMKFGAKEIEFIKNQKGKQ